MVIRCLFGFHEWEQSRALTVPEQIGTPEWRGEATPTRCCNRCGRVENVEDLRELRDKWEARYTGPCAPYKILEDEWNAKQDRVSYFWQIVAAVAIGLLLFLSLR